MLKHKKQVMICARTARALPSLALALLLSLLLAVAPSPSFASAEVSYPLTYGGRLVNDLGEPLAGPLALQFYFYDGAGASATLLRALPILSSAPLPLSDGVFSAQLNLSATDVQELFGDPQREVWIEVRAGEQVYGRQRFSYVPMALRVPVDGETIYFDPNDGKLKLKSAASGSGDMLQSIYDPGKNNKIDLAENTEKLGGQLPAYYSNASNITSGTLPIAQVPNLDAAKITTGTLAYARLPVGTAASTIAAGNDTRFTDARTPSGAAGGDLTGSYPDPTLATTGVTAGTYPKVTVDSKGRVTGASSTIAEADIADSAVTSAKIANATIVDADIASSAAIADSKLATISSAGKVSNSATTATSANTASAIVARDDFGNFTAGTITASLSGNVTGNLTGDVTGNVNGNASSATTASQIQGRAVASTAPNSGQVLTWDGSAWAAQTPTSNTAVTLVSKSADYTLTSSDAGKYFLVSGSETTLTLPSASIAGSGYAVTIKSTGVSVRILPVGSDTIDGESGVRIRLTSRSVVQLASDGSGWSILNEIGSVRRHLACSANCYTANTAVLSRGYGYTASGQYLDLINNSAWVQSDGPNVLSLDGTDSWHMQLAANGLSSTTTPLDKANVAGRACPTNVYVSDSQMVATGRCLYYDGGNTVQRLDATASDGVTDQSTAGAYRLGVWSTTAGGNSTGASWYEGNIQVCAAKGMRLPLLYETTAADPGGTYKPTDASPTWSTLTNGVPSVGDYYNWTASAYTNNSGNYWVWSGTSTSRLQLRPQLRRALCRAVVAPDTLTLET